MPRRACRGYTSLPVGRRSELGPRRRGPLATSRCEGRDLNRFDGPACLDASAPAVRGLLLRADLDLGPIRIGHGDFESQNIQWLDPSRWRCTTGTA